MHYASIEWDSQDIHYQAMSICRTLCAHFQYTSLFPENLASKHWESSSFLNSGWSSLVRSQGQLFSVTQKIKCYKKTQWKWNAMLLKHCYYYYFIFIFFGGDEEFQHKNCPKIYCWSCWFQKYDCAVVRYYHAMYSPQASVFLNSCVFIKIKKNNISMFHKLF